MKKILSKLLVFFMLFSCVSGSIQINAQAATDTQSNSSTTNYDETVQDTSSDENDEQASEGDRLGVDNLGIDNLPGDSSKQYSTYSVPNNAANSVSLSNCTNIRPIVIFIKFSDDKTEHFTQAKRNEIKEGLIGSGFSLGNYVNLVSYGKCSVDPIFTYDKNTFIYTAPHKSGYYREYKAGTNEEGYKTFSEKTSRRDELFNGAFKECTKNIDFSNVDLDRNGDGEVDSVYFFNSSEAYYREILYTEKWVLGNCPTIVDKSGKAKRVYTYMSIDKNYAGWGPRALTHEFSHNLGLPDMYPYVTVKQGLENACGHYTMMCDNAGYPTVLERMEYGKWISEEDIRTIKDDGNYILYDVTKNSNTHDIAYKIEIPNSDEYFMVEYRNKDANAVENLIPESGLLVYRVDPSRSGSGNTGEEPEIYVMRNSGQTADEGVLTGATGRKSVKLVLKSGEDTGYSIQFNSFGSECAHFKLVCNPGVRYSTIVQGNSSFEELSCDGKLSGTEGQAKRIDGLKMDTYAPDGSIKYRAYIRNVGWTNWLTSNEELRGNGNDIENIQVKLTGPLANWCSVYYRTHNRYYGWLGWTSNGASAGTSNYGSAIEGIQVRIIKNGTGVSGITDDTNSAYKENPQKYTVTFKDYNGKVLKTQTVSYGTSATAPSNPTRTGYTFAGWDKSFNLISQDTVVTAKYNINKYTVTFKNYNGTVLKTQTVSYGSSATAPSNPTRTGYTFVGWDKSFNFISQNTVVTATFTKDISVSLNVKSSNNYYKIYNNQTTVGNKLVLSGTTEYAQDPIQYVYTVKDSSGVTTTLTNYDSTNAYWQPTKTGKYTITLTVTDKTGNKASKSISFTVVDRISILSSSLDKSSPQVVGTKITAKVNVRGGIGNKKCIAMKAQGGNYQFGSKEVYFTMTGDFTGYWTPDTDGEYKLYAIVQDESGQTNQFSIGTYVIEKNQVTVYYNGYSSPYIHYQVGSGSWTNAPGVEMERSSDIDGYTHVASIDLGSASKLTACFNDGNGSWDSNGGNNYSFNAGYYTFKNGIITKIDKPTKKLSITSLTTNYSKGVTGLRPVTISTEVKDAQGTVKYTYTDIAADGTTKVIKSNTTDSTVSWLPSSYGKHNIKVTATDGVTTVTKSIDFSVNMYARVTISGPSKTSVGKNTTFTMNSTGGTGNITYKFYLATSSYSKSLLQSSYNNTLTWKPTASGIYYIYYAISDEGGDVDHEIGYIQVTVEEKVEAKTVIYYKGYSTPYIHYKIGNGLWTTAPGVKMESSSDVAGYTHMIELDLGDAENITACFNNGNNSWDSNHGENYTFGEGYYTFSNGTINKIAKPSSELRIKSITCDKGDTIKYGDKVKFTINAAGGSGTYTYSMTTSAYGSGRTLNLLSNSTSNTASWTPDYPRVIYITATVTDSTGKSVTYTEHFTVKQVTSNEITIYYKGYDNPYIHYKIGNGLWTTAPGIAMTKTSEKSGYTHKITIDLGDADNITACFNNGSGTWDSNYGENYHFNGVGTYTYSNGSINKIS